MEIVDRFQAMRHKGDSEWTLLSSFHSFDEGSKFLCGNHYRFAYKVGTYSKSNPNTRIYT